MEAAVVKCDGVIGLDVPIGRERRRSFQPPWYAVFLYRCPKCGRRVSVLASSFVGGNPVPGKGAILCG